MAPPEQEQITEQPDPAILKEHRNLLGAFRRHPIVGVVSHESPENAPPRFEFPEHGFIGDSVSLKFSDKDECKAHKKPFTLTNGVVATYGQINGLAGDFYGTDRPISDGGIFKDQCQRFRDAYATLAIDTTRQPSEANALLSILSAEVKAAQDARKQHEDPSKAWATTMISDDNISLEWQTLGRPHGCPTYLGLAEINWDHFGKDAHTAYVAGHTVALAAAKEGKSLANLEKAYTLNAFADHFLEDSFAAGHVRTPRRYLHGEVNLFYDLCAKAMHDEENAIGLTVRNRNGAQWKVYGDKRLLDKEDMRNFELCKAAIQASVDEIFDAWSGGPMPEIKDYAFWGFVPDLEVAMKGQELAPLFTAQGQRRANVLDRTEAVYTDDWTAAGTWLLVETSGWWNYPITINGRK